MSENNLLPSRKDENFRYTQISLSSDNASAKWETEKLSHTVKGETAFRPWKDDFYLSAMEGLKAAQVSAPKSEEWIFLHSQGEGNLRGATEITVPKGKSYKVFEFLENASEKSLLMRNIVVQEGAEIEYFVLQKQNLSNTFILRHFFDLAPTAKAKFRFFHTGAKKGQHRVVARVPKDADFLLEGATRLSNSQHVDFWAESEHVGQNSLSNTAVWNVLSDEAVAVFNGMIRILQNCPQTQAYQSNKTLLLSEKARVYTLPKLEISTDDVKCSHGASVSSLDPSQLFYLQSRGIGKEAAQYMLIDAFTQPVLQHLPRHLISDALKKELNLKRESDGT